MAFFKHIIFDLDDTLLDTSGALIPIVARRAIAAMITASPNSEHESADRWLARRREIMFQNPRADVWLELANGNIELAEIGRHSFYTQARETIPDEAVRLTHGAADILNWSQVHATLHLVTSGDTITQHGKIERLGIAKYFESIQVAPATHSSTTGSNKSIAFEMIARRFSDVDSDSFISIGNRVDTDLGSAKRLGWKTAWIRYGEHSTLTPTLPEEIPDFEVPTLSNLLSIWRQQSDTSLIR